jgi:hypothetical protein
VIEVTPRVSVEIRSASIALVIDEASVDAGEGNTCGRIEFDTRDLDDVMRALQLAKEADRG